MEASSKMPRTDLKKLYLAKNLEELNAKVDVNSGRKDTSPKL